MSKQFDLVMDRRTLDLIASLKPALNANSTAEVIRKSLGLAKVVADKARGSDGIVTMIGTGRPVAEAVHLDIRN